MAFLVAAVASSPLAFISAVNGMSEMLTYLLVVALVFLADRKERWAVLLAGVFLGLVCLNSFIAFSYVPFFPFYFLLMERSRPQRSRILDMLVWMGGFLLILIPWFWRTYILTGDPFFTLNGVNWAVGTRLSPDNSIYIQLRPVSLGSVLRADWPGFVDKYFRNLWFYAVHWVKASPVLVGMVILALQKRREPLLWLLTGCLAGSAVVYSTGSFGEDRYLASLYFVLAIVSARALRGDERSWVKKMAPAAGVVAIAWNVGLTLRGNVPTYLSSTPTHLDQIKVIQSVTSKDDIIVSDIAPALAWYGDRHSNWTPYDLSILKKVSRIFRVTAVHFRKAGKDIPDYCYPRVAT